MNRICIRNLGNRVSDVSSSKDGKYLYGHDASDERDLPLPRNVNPICREFRPYASWNRDVVLEVTILHAVYMMAPKNRVMNTSFSNRNVRGATTVRSVTLDFFASGTAPSSASFCPTIVYINGLWMPLSGTLPLPAIGRNVSGSRIRSDNVQTPAHIARNQKIDRKPQACVKRPPKTGPTPWPSWRTVPTYQLASFNLVCAFKRIITSTEDPHQTTSFRRGSDIANDTRTYKRTRWLAC